MLDRTIGADEFAHSDEHELLGDLPRGLQLGLELGYHKAEVGAGQSHQDVTSSRLRVFRHALKKRLR